MANTAQDFEAYFITHREVKQANPTWSDRMVDDYISIKTNIVYLADQGDRNLEEILLRLDSSEARLDSAEVRLDALEALLPISVYLTANHTTTKNEIITCENSVAITVTLNAAPLDQEMVQVKRNNSKVIISGNGKTVDGSATVTLSKQYVGLTLIYSQEADSWGIR